MGEILSSILLLASAELLMTFPDQCFEDSRSDTVLIELIFLLFVSFDLLTFNNDLLGYFFGRVFSRLETNNQFWDLALATIRSPFWTIHQMLLSGLQIVISELW